MVAQFKTAVFWESHGQMFAKRLLCFVVCFMQVLQVLATHLTSLTNLELRELDSITGKGVKELANLSTLTRLNLGGSPFVSDEGAAAIAKLPSLRR